MLVAITGGNGFIGQHLVQCHLEHGDEVRVLTRHDQQGKDGVSVVVGDLTQDGDHLDELVDGVDILYHCAGEVSDQDSMHAVHVEGTSRLVGVAKGRIGRWVQLSSVGAYGVRHAGTVTEQSDECPENVYEVTKTKSDDIVRQSGIPFVILRPSIVFGKTMTNQSLFQMLGMIRKGLFFYIGAPGALVKALYFCAVDPRAIGETYNLSQTTQLEDMVGALKSGACITASILRLPRLPVYLVAVMFGWLPGFPLTKARVAALSGRCCYASDKIVEELEFRFASTLVDRFRQFAKIS